MQQTPRTNITGNTASLMAAMERFSAPLKQEAREKSPAQLKRIVVNGVALQPTSDSKDKTGNTLKYTRPYLIYLDDNGKNLFGHVAPLTKLPDYMKAGITNVDIVGAALAKYMDTYSEELSREIEGL